MIVPDLGALLVSLSEIFPLVVQLVFILIAMLGIWVGTGGLFALYNVAAGEYKFSNRPVTIDVAIGKIMLAGAMIVAPSLLWRFANSFVLGGNITYSLFNYGAIDRTAPCDQIRVAISYFFMALGSVAWLTAALKLYHATAAHHPGAGSAVMYLVGGTLAFFVNDVARLVGNTIHMDVSLDNVCAMMGR